jgi:hypothetical protein
MRRKIAKIEQRANGHALVVFEDGSQKMFVRGDHEKLVVGDYYPLLPKRKRD